MSPFVQQLPSLLRLLADPVTPHTAAELWCRIHAAEWTECVPVLASELQTGEPDVKRLVLGILGEEAEHIGIESTHSFTEAVERLLSDKDRLVRASAIQAVRDLQAATPTATASLRRIVCNDDAILAREALIALLEVDEGVVEKIIHLLRGHDG